MWEEGWVCEEEGWRWCGGEGVWEEGGGVGRGRGCGKREGVWEEGGGVGRGRGCGKRDECVRRDGCVRRGGVWEEGWVCEAGGWRWCANKAKECNYGGWAGFCST